MIKTQRQMSNRQIIANFHEYLQEELAREKEKLEVMRHNINRRKARYGAARTRTRKAQEKA